MITEFFLSVNNGSPGDLASGAGKINNSGNFYFYAVYYFIAVLLIFAVLFFLRKYFMRKLGRVRSGAYMKIADSISVGREKQILLIELKNRIIIAGVTRDKIEMLTELSKEEFGTLDDINNDSENLNEGNDFMSVLKNKFNFKNKKENDGNENENKNEEE